MTLDKKIQIHQTRRNRGKKKKESVTLFTPGGHATAELHQTLEATGNKSKFKFDEW